jgi:tight adherence protein B
VFTLTLINPDYMKPLIYDPRGHLAILVAVILQLLGILVIKRILDIKI